MREAEGVSCLRDILPLLSQTRGVHGSGEKAHRGLQSEQKFY